MLWYRTKSWNRRLVGDLSADFEYGTSSVVSDWTTARQSRTQTEIACLRTHKADMLPCTSDHACTFKSCKLSNVNS